MWSREDTVRKLTVKNFSVIKEAELEFGKIIVCSRSPMSSSELQNMKAKALIRYKLWLEVDESGKKEYPFSTFEQI